MSDDEELRGWLSGRLPEDWFSEPPQITADRDEILLVGRIVEPALAEGASEGEAAAARAGRIKQFREETRERRIAVAREAERRFGRTVSWGVECGETRELFTTLSVPHMTRLRIEERAVLDALVAAGVARSRSHALAWCVRLVAKNQGEWIRELTEALRSVERVRALGPDVA